MKTQTQSPVKQISKRSRHDLATVQRGLTAVAYANGNTAQASRDLAEDGINLPQRTLWEMVHQRYPDEYGRIKREILPIVGSQVADEHMGLARKMIGVADQLADRLAAESSKLDIRDVPGALRNASTGSGIHTDKARDLAGDYATPGKHQSAAEILRSLASKGIVTEVIDAEVIDD